MNHYYQLEQVSFSYGDQPLLKIQKQSIEAGKVTALVGSNGAGKSTLLRLLALLHLPNTGQIKLADNLVNKNSMRELRKKIGLVQQNPYLLEGTVAKNIGLGLKLNGVSFEERKHKVQEMLALLQIEQLSERSAKTLSGGEAQKVAIGRALVLEPEVLLLDEPFTHLDKKFIEEFEALILDLKNKHNKTIVFTTHNQLQAQALSDTVLSLINGELLKSSLSNLLHGHVDSGEHIFDTGKLKVFIPEGFEESKHLAIEPELIVLSKETLKSSMRNSFSGEVIGMHNENGKVRVSVDCGEIIHAYVTKEALSELKLHIHDDVRVNFKSSSVRLF